jgi:tetratricopeptide (TPR) repeat protein
MPSLHTAVPTPALIEQAQQALAAQQWTQALALARQALALALALPGPARVEALYVVAQCQWRLGLLPQAQQTARQAAELAAEQGLITLQIRSLGMAAIALSELSLADDALPLALQALRLAQRPDQHAQLPGALSCAAHVHARRGELEHAELMHMQALSLARETGEIKTLHQAYCNLLAAFVVAYKQRCASGQAAAAQAAAARAQRHTSHVRSLLADARMDEYQRLPLLLSLGHVLLLNGRLGEAEALLLQARQLAERLGANYYRLAAHRIQAELRLMQGQPAQALQLLGELLDPASGQGGFSQHLSALHTALDCHRALGQEEPARMLALELDRLLHTREPMRQQARQA